MPRKLTHWASSTRTRGSFGVTLIPSLIPMSRYLRRRDGSHILGSAQTPVRAPLREVLPDPVGCGRLAGSALGRLVRIDIDANHATVPQQTSCCLGAHIPQSKK